jgi:hypothetical protein
MSATRVLREYSKRSPMLRQLRRERDYLKEGLDDSFRPYSPENVAAARKAIEQSIKGFAPTPPLDDVDHWQVWLHSDSVGWYFSKRCVREALRSLR